MAQARGDFFPASMAETGARSLGGAEMCNVNVGLTDALRLGREVLFGAQEGAAFVAISSTVGEHRCDASLSFLAETRNNEQEGTASVTVGSYAFEGAELASPSNAFDHVPSVAQLTDFQTAPTVALTCSTRSSPPGAHK